MTSSTHNTGSTQHIATPSKQNRARCSRRNKFGGLDESGQTRRRGRRNVSLILATARPTFPVRRRLREATRKYPNVPNAAERQRYRGVPERWAITLRRLASSDRGSRRIATTEMVDKRGGGSRGGADANERKDSKRLPQRQTSTYIRRRRVRSSKQRRRQFAPT